METENMENKQGQEAPIDEVKEEKAPVASQEEGNQDKKVDETTEIDYKAELEKAQATIDKQEKRINQADHNIEKLKKEKKEEVDDFDFGDDDEPKQDIDSIIEEKMNKFKVDFSSQSIDGEIEKMTDNVDERKLIKHHYENTIKQTGFDLGSIKKDLQNAYIQANSARILNQNTEFKQALKAKNTLSKGTGGGSAGSGIKSNDWPDNLSEADIAFLKSRGQTPESYNKSLNK